MKQFKKILVGCLLVLVLSSVTACGTNDNADNNNGTNADDATNNGTPTMTTPMALRMELRITGTPRMIPPTAQAMQTKMVQAIMAQPTTEATELWMIWAMT